MVSPILEREFTYYMKHGELSQWAKLNLPPSVQGDIINAKIAFDDGNAFAANFKDVIPTDKGF